MRWKSKGVRSLRASVVLAVTLVLVTATSPQASGAPGAGATRVPVTFVGDSVSASIGYVPAAQKALRRGGLSVRLDAAVCRRLVQPSCAFQGSTPPSALAAVRSYGRSLGRVLVVSVGYNEDGRGYRQGIDLVLRAALAQGATGVVWVTLKETSPLYRGTNAAIRQAEKRWPQLIVADWNAHSTGKPWFGSDGLHLSTEGAIQLARFLRAHVLRAASRG